MTSIHSKLKNSRNVKGGTMMNLFTPIIVTATVLFLAWKVGNNEKRGE